MKGPLIRVADWFVFDVPEWLQVASILLFVCCLLMAALTATHLEDYRLCRSEGHSRLVCLTFASNSSTASCGCRSGYYKSEAR